MVVTCQFYLKLQNWPNLGDIVHDAGPWSVFSQVGVANFYILIVRSYSLAM